MNYKHLQNGSDIRGIALEGIPGEKVNLTKEAVYDLARGFVKYLRDKTNKKEVTISVGHDSRLSADMLKQSIIDGLLFDGATVLECGLSSTPAMFMSTVYEEFKCDGAIMITASHLPFNRNGMKFFDKDGGLNKEDIATIIKHAENQEFDHISGASCTRANLMDVYAQNLQNIIKEKVNAQDYDQPLKGLHVVIDAGNGAGGFYATKVLEPLGANVEGSQFLDPDGSFPNHIPNPEDKKAMASICEAVKKNNADLGIIFDTDVDRSSAVDHLGNPISRNAIVALAAILANNIHQGTTIVTDSVTSDELADFLKKHGIGHHRFKRGYKNVINEGIRLNNEGVDCQLAIETSGHAAFKENYFLDDGAYLATLIVVEAAKGKVADLISDLEYPLEEKELRFKILDEDFQKVGDVLLEDLKAYVAKQSNMKPADTNYEGYRVCFDHGWFLVRKSLHDPIIPCNIESKKEGGCKEIAKELYVFLKDNTSLDLSVITNYLEL
ncbi:MAG: phosphomannomutase/phosphoglucomutase [Firmicutes bacterium]|nr:phosphomannomutase/phosphoglucomutase [Bacillota bacterium]